MSLNKTSSETESVLVLSPFLTFLYGVPLVAFSFLLGPMAILQGIYVKYFGLALTSIAAVLLVARLFDAITDPIIGYWADKYYALQGTYKPFIISGGVLFIIASWFLYVPYQFIVGSDEVSANVTTQYFLVWFLVFYLAYTLFEIPHLAWGSELASKSLEKNRIFGFRSLCAFVGVLLFYAMPLLPIFETSEFTPETLKWSVIVAGSLMMPMIYGCTKAVPSRFGRSEARYKKHMQLAISGCQSNMHLNRRQSWWDVTHDMFANKPLRILTVAHLCGGLGSGMWFTLVFLFADSYLRLGEQFAMVYVISFGVSIIALKLWYELALIFGKQAILATGMVLVVIGSLSTGFLSPESGGMWLLFCMTLIFCGYAAFSIMLPSLLSDIVDYGSLKFGKDHTASYFSLYTLLNKSAAALGGSLSLALAGWYEFDPTVASHSDETIAGLRTVVAWIPALITLVSIIFILHIPITHRRHEIILRRLDTRI